MRFPQYKYQEFNNSNKSIHPAPWCEMLKGSKEYCKSLTDVFEFEGLCREVELPSEHPYWKLQSFKQTLELIDCTRGSIFEIEKFIESNPNHSRVGSAKIMITNQKKSLKFYCSRISFI